MDTRSTLLTGNAGCGKTTALQRLAYNWATMPLKTQAVKVMYRYECRKIPQLQQISLADFIFNSHEHYNLDAETQDAILETIDAPTTLIVFDGLGRVA